MRKMYGTMLLAGILGAGQMAHPFNRAIAAEKTVEGTLVVDLDDDGNVTDASVTTESGDKYALKLDSEMKKRGKELAGKKVEVTGEMSEQNEKRTIEPTALKAKSEQ